MIKNYKQFINEDLRSKNITSDVPCDNLAQLYPGMQLKYNDDYKIGVSYCELLKLDKEFYEALKKDGISKDKIMFENCEAIFLYDINEFTKVSDYGLFGTGIKIFGCVRCGKLTSLDGAPEKVSGNFQCWGCMNLTNLKGAPEIVSDSFYCSDCVNLTSLDGAPEKVGGNFNCRNCTKLTSIEGAPKEVTGSFDCRNCAKLTNLDDAPEKVGGNFSCTGCNPNFINLAKEKYGFKVIA